MTLVYGFKTANQIALFGDTGIVEHDMQAQPHDGILKVHKLSADLAVGFAGDPTTFRSVMGRLGAIGSRGIDGAVAYFSAQGNACDYILACAKERRLIRIQQGTVLEAKNETLIGDLQARERFHQYRRKSRPGRKEVWSVEIFGPIDPGTAQDLSDTIVAFRDVVECEIPQVGGFWTAIRSLGNEFQYLSCAGRLFDDLDNGRLAASQAEALTYRFSTIVPDDPFTSAIAYYFPYSGLCYSFRALEEKANVFLEFNSGAVEQRLGDLWNTKVAASYLAHEKPEP